SGGGAADSRAADSVGRAGACAADQHAPHRIGRMVAGGGVRRGERVVRGVWEGVRGSVAGVGSAVYGLCSVAAEVDGRGGTGRAGGVLEKESGRGAGDAGVAGGSSATGAAGLCRGGAAGGIERGVDGGVEGTERAAGDNAVHDATGGVGGVAGQVVGAAGCGGGGAGSESPINRDREPDRFFREHAGDAGGHLWPGEGGRTAAAGEGAGAGGAGASGHSVRAGGGVAATGAQSGAQSAVPGGVCLAGRSRGQARTAGAGDNATPLVGASGFEIRSDVELTGVWRADRGGSGVCDGAV